MIRRSFFILLGLLSIKGTTVFSANITWQGPGTDFNTGTNWQGNTAPGINDVAVFNSAQPTTLSFSAFATPLAGITFSGAAFTLVISTASHAAVLTSGIVNTSGNTQTLLNEGDFGMQNAGSVLGSNLNVDNSSGTIEIDTLASAGSAIIHNAGRGATITFDNATAGNATLINGATIQFVNGSDASHATLINNAGGLIAFGGTSASSAVILNKAGAVLRLTGSAAAFGLPDITNDGFFDAQLVTSGLLPVGSLSGSGTVALANGVTLALNNDLSTTFSGNISGFGASIEKMGTGTLTLTGHNTYTGITTILSGGVNLLGSLVGDVIINPGTILSGTGSAGNITNNGILTPGVNGVGTLTATSYNLAGTGGTLNVGFDGAQHGAINTPGSARLNPGRLNIFGTNFGVGRYSVVHSGSLTGTFSTFTSPVSSFLTFAPEYTATDAYVAINFTTPFAPFAQNANQLQVATNLNESKMSSSAEFTNAIGSLGALPASQVSQAMTQVSGDSLATFQRLGLEHSAFFTKGLRDRALSVSTGTCGLWAQGVGFADSVKGDSGIGSPGSRSTTGGFQAGYDVLFGDNLLGGYSGGYAETEVDVADRDSTGNTRAIQSGLYLRYAEGPWYAHGSFSFTSEANDMTRTIRYGTVNEKAASDFNSRIYTSFLEGGYALSPLRMIIVEPAISLRQSHLNQDGFSETGAPGLGLTVADRITDSWVSSLGFNLKRDFYQDAPHSFSLKGTLAWEHEWADPANVLSAHFAETSGGSDFTVAGTPRRRDSAAIGLEGRVPLRSNIELIGSYTAKVSSMETTQNLFGGARLKW